jgi:hypothetical protein
MIVVNHWADHSQDLSLPRLGHRHEGTTLAYSHIFIFNFQVIIEWFCWTGRNTGSLLPKIWTSMQMMLMYECGDPTGQAPLWICLTEERGRKYEVLNLNPWLGSLKLKQKAKKIIHMTW